MGNRRYARKHRLGHPRVAYDFGAEKLDEVLAWCLDLGIPASARSIRRLVSLWHPRLAQALDDPNPRFERADQSLDL
jgi:short-chain Z-isoprenyl diphosphate synthase